MFGDPLLVQQRRERPEVRKGPDGLLGDGELDCPLDRLGGELDEPVGEIGIRPLRKRASHACVSVPRNRHGGMLAYRMFEKA